MLLTFINVLNNFFSNGVSFQRGSTTSLRSFSSNTWPISRLLGLDVVFKRRLFGLLKLGYKFRLRLPLVVSAGAFHDLNNSFLHLCIVTNSSFINY